MDPARVDEVEAGGVVELRSKRHSPGLRSALGVHDPDTLVRVARSLEATSPGSTIAWGFALAAWEMGLDLTRSPHLTRTTYDGSRTPEASARAAADRSLLLVTSSFDKRRRKGWIGGARTAMIWRVRSLGIGRFLRGLRSARNWFAERQLDVTNEKLPIGPARFRKVPFPLPSSTQRRATLLATWMPCPCSRLRWGTVRSVDRVIWATRASASVCRGEVSTTLQASSSFPSALRPGEAATRVFAARLRRTTTCRSKASRADFKVFADGRVVAVALEVAPRAPQTLEADVRGAARLELRVETRQWRGCHSIWLDPEVSSAVDPGSSTMLVDCLKRVQIEVPKDQVPARRCIATVVSPG